MKRVKLTGFDTTELPVLSNEEMMDLFAQLEAGSNEARQKIISGNLRLVLSVLQRFRNNKYTIDDLFQVGCVGLIKAVDNFDSTRGVKFSTYAVPMIIGEVKRHIRDNKRVRVSRSLRQIAYQALKFKEELRKKKGVEPTLEEIAEEMDVPREKIVHSLEAVKNPISLFKPVFEEEGDSLLLLDQLESSEQINWIEGINLRQALKKLTAREQLIIKLKFYEGKTQTEIAEKVGVSQAQISRIQKKALNKLQQEVKVKEEIKCAE
ncbi:RNA polymerase sigma-70 factor, sigma-B/F/G subfamily [Halobacteroides halobius DSM 5150]|uniref:RNA polymerase sigma factor n=1 Tax=Halobacteroides halobius (strain ATCC 35273 / DSM 5150 / MD-1) TaxID=748449 RepID=L0KD10_HALHC|nr:SigB/SigF/SigG family RNA polymerase sigma factor [Halobacteroides halobius]AGB42430.1 RNA polymerase sigma-70 factor, sigma-B/F/G subfamily [Halobacteroides halobius DSM 5150]